MRLARVVEIHAVSKWYGAVIGVNQISLDLAPGLTGLLGPNGAGKSTLMKLVTGQLRPSIGDVKVLGKSIWRNTAARNAIGYSPDLDSFHEEFTGFRFVYSMARLSGLSRREARRKTGETLARVGMTSRAQKLMRQCSKGMRQRIKLAQALVHDPRVLVLDEPLSGVDPAGREDLLELFRELRAAGKTVLISSHILDEVEAVTDRIVLMAYGRVLVAGTVERIRGLMEDYPLTVRVVTDRGRDLAAELIRNERITSVSVAARGEGASDVVVRTRRPDEFFRELPHLVTSMGLEVESVEALDASAAAVFAYLVGGEGRAWRHV